MTVQVLTLGLILLLAAAGVSVVLLRLGGGDKLPPFGDEPDGGAAPSGAGQKPQAIGDFYDMRETRDGIFEATNVDSASAAVDPAWEATADLRPDRRRSNIRPLALLAALLVLLLLGWGGYAWVTSNNPDTFIVAVAPFHDLGSGQVSESGRAVAADLARELSQRSGGHVVAVTLSQAPANEREALQLINSGQSDLLIWGDVRPGGMLNAETLLPKLVYRPTGQYAPAAWDGYYGRVAPPMLTQLSDQPINGAAIIPPLVESLDAYARGDFQLAFQQLGALQENYPALRPALPSALRGSILWASDDLKAAVAEYRKGLRGATIEQPFLYSNIAAAQLDDNQPQAAVESLSQARASISSALTSNQIQESAQAQVIASLLPQIGINLATERLRVNDTQAAYELPGQMSAPMQQSLVALLTRQAALRGSGDSDQAEAMMQQVRAELRREVSMAPSDLQPYIRQRLNNIIQEQQTLISLSQLTPPPRSGHLEWDLEAADPQPPAKIAPLVTSFDSIIGSGQDLAREWRQLATSAEAAGKPINSRVADGQARRLERQIDEQRYLQAVLLIEQSRQDLPRRNPSFIASLIDSLFGTPAGSAAQILGGLGNSAINIDAQIQLGRALYLVGNRDGALSAFRRAQELDARRPEPLYGQAVLALDEGRRDDARSLLNQAVALDSSYFVARKLLAQLALEDSNLAAAAEQQLWLANYYKDEQSAIALATTLRRSGPAGYQQAEELLRPIVQTNRSAQIEAGRLYRAAGRPVEAETWLSKAASAQPPLAEASFEYGQFLETQQRYPEAAAQYQRAIDSDANAIGARVALANLYAGALNRPADAVSQFTQVLNADIQDVDQLVAAGDAMLQFGQPKQALDAYNRALQLRESEPLLYHKVAQAYLALDRLDDARSFEQQALDRSGNGLTVALAGMGEIERRRGNLAGARSLFEQALQRDGSLIEAQIGIGRTTADEQNWTVALSYFRSAVAAQPGNALAHFWVGEALLRQPTPQASEALGEYDAALLAQGNFPESLLGKAQAYLALTQPENAKAQLVKALELRPTYAEALLLSGKIAQSEGDNRQALADYNRSISSNSGIPETYYRRALLEIQQEDYRSARSDLQSAVNVQANFAEAHYWLGRIALIDGDFTTARDAFDKAIAIQPDFADAQALRNQAQQRLDAQAAAAS